MTPPVKSILTVLSMGIILLLVGIGVWMTQTPNPPLTMSTYRIPPGVMDTPQFNITLVMRPDQVERTETILAQATSAVRQVETLMNIHNPASELSQFNLAPAGQPQPLSPPTIEVLTDASLLWERSGEAFDVTIQPLVQLWKQAAQTDRIPTDADIRQARNASRWRYIEITDLGATKTVDTTAVDLGGIAKGFAIDQAIQALQQGGCAGGIVDVGGDIRCFGVKPSGDPWRVGIVNPFTPNSSQNLTIVALYDGAVCTSGNYRRFSVIEGQQYSHILDPRTGRPADAAPSVTVMAPTATTADGWATALSVLGEEGLHLLRGTSIEAMLVVGTAEEYRVVCTPGFVELFETAPTVPVTTR
jgi:thiamine biosynthesis lipoprotein